VNIFDVLKPTKPVDIMSPTQLTTSGVMAAEGRVKYVTAANRSLAVRSKQSLGH